MATQSPNLDLRIPAYGDETDAVADIAENMTKIDTFAGTVGSGGPGIPTFSYAGTLAGATSGRWYPTAPTHLTHVTASLGSEATGDTVVEGLHNGVSFVTITIPTGAFVAGQNCDETIAGPETDYLQFVISTPGAGGADLVVQPS